MANADPDLLVWQRARQLDQAAFGQLRAKQNAYPAGAKTRSFVSALSGGTGSPNGLVTSGLTPDINSEDVTSWTYDYHLDPDLTSSRLNLSLYLPRVNTVQDPFGINMVTVTLTSHPLNSSVYSSQTWGFDNTLQAGLLAPSSGHIQNFQWSLSTGSGADGSNYFKRDAGSDLQNVYFVNIGYRGTAGNSFPITPANEARLWTGTESLTILSDITQEPGPFMLLGGGLLAAVLFHCRARKRGCPSCA